MNSDNGGGITGEEGQKTYNVPHPDLDQPL